MSGHRRRVRLGDRARHANILRAPEIQEFARAKYLPSATRERLGFWRHSSAEPPGWAPHQFRPVLGPDSKNEAPTNSSDLRLNNVIRLSRDRCRNPVSHSTKEHINA